jgi:RNA polymerase sigma factor (sigma-70 family)
MPKNDQELLAAARDGSRAAVEQLLRQHRPYIYNLAWRLTLSPDDAEDLTQEVLIKALQHLPTFEARSSFRTWLHRIATNHFLEMKRRPMEGVISSFEAYGEALDQVPMADMSAEEQHTHQELIAEANMSCMAGMLLCLERRQRMVYILGELLETDSATAAALLEETPENFRQLLSRARKELRAFMNHTCGLVNPQNPCRCHRKTRGFVAAGWVDPQRLRFHLPHRQRIVDTLPNKVAQLNQWMASEPVYHLQQMPFDDGDRPQAIAQLLDSPELRQLFELP